MGHYVSIYIKLKKDIDDINNIPVEAIGKYKARAAKASRKDNLSSKTSRRRG